MKVRATKLGFRGSRVYPGTIFELEDIEVKKDGKVVVITAEQQFSNKWMEKVEEYLPVTDKIHILEPEIPAVDEVKKDPDEEVTKKKKKKSIKKEDVEGEE